MKPTQLLLQTADQQPPWPYTNGVYALGNASGGSLPPAIFANPNISGVALRAWWGNLETAEGVYDWSLWDSQIAQAVANGLMVSLSVTAGIQTPPWVYAAGAASYTGADGTMPLPWDPVFLAKWQAFINAMGSRYAQHPNVAHVKLTGIAYRSQESSQPNQQADLAPLQAAGYTRAKVEAAWTTIADYWAQAFPAKRIACMFNPSGFPGIDDNGALTGQTTDRQTTLDLLAKLTTLHPAQGIGQNNGASATWMWAPLAAVAGQIATGYQAVWFVTGDSTYRMNGGKADTPANIMQAAFNAAVAAGGRFYETYQPDVQNPTLQAIIGAANAAMQ